MKNRARFISCPWLCSKKDTLEPCPDIRLNLHAVVFGDLLYRQVLGGQCRNGMFFQISFIDGGDYGHRRDETTA